MARTALPPDRTVTTSPSSCRWPRRASTPSRRAREILRGPPRGRPVARPGLGRRVLRGHHAMDAGESEDAFRFAQMAPGLEVGRVEFQVAEGAYGPVARGGDVLDRDGSTGVDGMGDLPDVGVRQVLRVSGDDLLGVRAERHPGPERV